MFRTIHRRQASSRRDQGFTLIELLVVIIIVGVLAAIAVPQFIKQREKGFDAQVKSDLRSYVTLAQTYDGPTPYPTTLSGLSGVVGQAPPSSPGTAYKAYTVTTGANTGMVIVGTHEATGRTWAVSTWNGSTPVLISDAATTWSGGIVTSWGLADAMIRPELGNVGVTWDTVNGIRWGKTHSVGPM